MHVAGKMNVEVCVDVELQQLGFFSFSKKKVKLCVCKNILLISSRLGVPTRSWILMADFQPYTLIIVHVQSLYYEKQYCLFSFII